MQLIYVVHLQSCLFVEIMYLVLNRRKNVLVLTGVAIFRITRWLQSLPNLESSEMADR